jgi:hypothetical protein
MSRFLVLAIGVLFLATSSLGQSDSPMAHDVLREFVMKSNVEPVQTLSK